MSNSFTIPPVLPDSSTVVAGQEISSISLSKMGDLSNYMDAYGGSTNIVSQAYDEDVFIVDYTIVPTLPNSSWRVPSISSKHLSLDVYIIANCSLSTSTISIDGDFGSGVINQTITVNTTGYSTFSATLTFSSITQLYGDIDLRVYNTLSTAVTRIRTIMIRWSPLASPVSTGSSVLGSDLCTPFGVARLGANQALTSRVGHQLLENINHFRKRPRVLISWSGLFGTSPITPSTSPPRTLGFGDVDILKPLAPYFASVNPSSHQFTVALKVGGSSIPISLTIMGNEINTTGGIGWITQTFTVLIDTDSRSLEFNQDLCKWGLDSTQLNITALTSLGSTAGFIESFTLWSC